MRVPPILPPQWTPRVTDGGRGLSQLLGACDLESVRPRSSTGQSTGLLILGLQVRVLPGALPLHTSTRPGAEGRNRGPANAPTPPIRLDHSPGNSPAKIRFVPFNTDLTEAGPLSSSVIRQKPTE